mgnify:CR=1 FL=1
MVGTFSYTCALFAFKNVPVTIFIVIMGTSTFFTAILGWVISGEKVMPIEFVFMFGSFVGIVFIA